MPAVESFAVLADIHGNSWALDAILADARRHWVQQVLNLGDCLYGTHDPAGVIEQLTGLGIPTVRGS